MGLTLQRLLSQNPEKVTDCRVAVSQRGTQVSLTLLMDTDGLWLLLEASWFFEQIPADLATGKGMATVLPLSGKDLKDQSQSVQFLLY